MAKAGSIGGPAGPKGMNAMRAIKALMVTMTVTASLVVGVAASSDAAGASVKQSTRWCC